MIPSLSNITNDSNDTIQVIYTKYNAKFTKSKLPDKSLTTKILGNCPTRRNSFNPKYNKQTENKDARKEVTYRDLNQLPYSAIVSLTMVSGLNSFNGNGVFVGPFHILTSRENIIQASSEWFTEIFVSAGLKGDEAIFGLAKVVAVRTFDTNYDNPELNLALIIIDQPLGKATGWMGMYVFQGEEELTQLPVTLAGYPGFVNRMHYESGRVTAKSEILEHTMLIAQGSSGSPIWFQKDGDYFVVGIHIHSSGAINIACRLSMSKFEFLVENKSLLHKILNNGEKVEDFAELENNVCIYN